MSPGNNQKRRVILYKIVRLYSLNISLQIKKKWLFNKNYIKLIIIVY